jgi:hypothetical protein
LKHTGQTGRSFGKRFKEPFFSFRYNNYIVQICLKVNWSWSLHLEIYRMWCIIKMEYISWTDRVENEEVLLKVKEERNILYTVKRRAAEWICQILCRNCLLKDGRIYVTGRRGRKHMQLLDGLKEKRG